VTALYLLLIPGAWCLICFSLSQISGWNKLAVRYHAGRPSSLQTSKPDNSVEPDVASLRTGKLGPITYRSCLRFETTSRGLGISIAPPLRLGHPPLLIPWDQFHRCREDTRMYSRGVKISVGRPTIVVATLPAWVRYRLPESLRPGDAITNRMA